MGAVGTSSNILSLDENSALYSYSSSNFWYINEYLRGKNLGSYKYSNSSYNNDKKPDDAVLEKIIKNLDNALRKSNKLSEDVTIYRGVGENVLSNLNVGDIYRDKGFSSGSIGEENYWNEATLKIKLPKGTRPGRDITGNSLFLDIEKEFLLKRNAPIKITSVDRDKSGRLIVSGVYVGK